MIVPYVPITKITNSGYELTIYVSQDLTTAKLVHKILSCPKIVIFKLWAYDMYGCMGCDCWVQSWVMNEVRVRSMINGALTSNVMSLIRIFLLSGRATSSSVKLVIPLPIKGKSRTIIVYVWPLNIYFRQTSNFLPETVITINGFQCLQNLSLARNKRKHSKFYLYKLTHVTSSGMY